MATIDGLLFALTLLAALGSGLMAGLFFAFSVSVMKALSRLSSAEGIAAMQSINAAILNPVFFAVFFGTAAACALAVVASLLRWHDPGAAYLLAGGVLYLIGGFLVTVVAHVPRNRALASVDATALEPRPDRSLACRRGGIHPRALLMPTMGCAKPARSRP